MPRERRDRYGAQAITLRQATVIAVLLHLMLGGFLQWNSDLLWSEPAAPPQPQPLEFRFVDVPSPAVEETPDTDVLSDVDRIAADASDRDDAEDPFSEGNTPQEVLRSDSEAQPEEVPPSPVAVPQPVTAPPDPLAASAETTAAASAETVTSDASRAEETTAPPEADATVPLATEAPPLPPPRTASLRDSLLRGLQQYVEPEVFANSNGGVDGSQGLVSFDTKGYDLGAYIAEVLRIIERNWKSNIPPAARVQGQRGAVFVNMSIVRDLERPGGEKAVILVSRSWSSGKPAFDQSALFALEISSPLPPLPAFFPYDQLDGRLGFLYNLDPSQVTFPVER